MDVNNKVFVSPFHWSGSIWAWTLGSVILLVGLFVMMLRMPDAGVIFKYSAAAFPLVIILGCVCFAPVRLRIDTEKITLSKVVGEFELPLDRVTEVCRVYKKEWSGTLRTFGVGGLAGHYGKFLNKQLGKFTMYSTDMKHLFMVRVDDRPYVFSCSRADEAVEFIRVLTPGTGPGGAGLSL